MTPEDIQQLHAYNRWADAQVWHCTMQLTDAQFVQDTGYSFGSLRNQWVHVMSTMNRWLGRLAERELPPHFEFDAYPTRAATIAVFREVEERLRDYVEGIDQTALNGVIHYDMPHRGGRFSTPRWQILTHLVNHGTDHRAQILATLHRLGGPTVEQDMAIFLWQQDHAQDRG